MGPVTIAKETWHTVGACTIGARYQHVGPQRKAMPSHLVLVKRYISIIYVLTNSQCSLICDLASTGASYDIFISSALVLAKSHFGLPTNPISTIFINLSWASTSGKIITDEIVICHDLSEPVLWCNPDSIY